MPYKKRTPEQFKEFIRLLKGYDLNATKLSKVLGCTYPTAKAKLDDPLRFTFKDVVAIHRKGHISKEELEETIKWD